MLVACRVWDTETLECVKVLEGHNEAVLALAVGPTFLVSGSYDTTVRFWALDSLRCVRCTEPSCLNIAESLSDSKEASSNCSAPHSLVVKLTGHQEHKGMILAIEACPSELVKVPFYSPNTLKLSWFSCPPALWHLLRLPYNRAIASMAGALSGADSAT